ncbi:unnamed protein product, partial [Staurois parvus]
ACVPLMATAVNHRVAAGESLLAPRDHRGTLKGERSVCKKYRSLPCQHQHAALHCSA